MYHLLIFYFLEFYQGKLTVSCFSKDHRKVFSNMALRLGKKLLFAVMVTPLIEVLISETEFTVKSKVTIESQPYAFITV